MSGWVTSRDLSTAAAGFQVEQGVVGFLTSLTAVR